MNNLFTVVFKYGCISGMDGERMSVATTGSSGSLHAEVINIKMDINDDDEGELEEESKVKRMKKFTKKLYEHTSVNGMFMLIMSGTKNQNSVAGIVVKKPENDS